MDENGFSLYMKEKRNPPHKIRSYVNRIKRFEQYLITRKNGKPVKDLAIDDLEKYAKWCEANNTNPYQELWGIREYYGFLGIEELYYSCSQVMQMIQLEKFKLKDFLTANQTYTKKLAKIGITTAGKILQAGKTKKGREEIARKSEVPVEQVLKFVKLANLARCPGHMKKRACLYYESGLDTFDKIAGQDPEKMVEYLDKFIRRTGFDGSAPTLADAKGSVENSKRIPRIIEF